MFLFLKIVKETPRVGVKKKLLSVITIRLVAPFKAKGISMPRTRTTDTVYLTRKPM